MKKHLIVSTLTLGLLAHAHAASFVGAVVDYTQGTPPPTAASLNNPNAALGAPAPLVSAGTIYQAVFSPFNPPFEPTDVVSIGTGGQLTLQLSHYVAINRTPGNPEIGVWENVGIADENYPNGDAGASPFFFGTNSAMVQVSPDNVTWYSLNGGSAISFGLPGNYFTNATTPFDANAPASPQYADFGKPFLGTQADFNGKNFSQILTLLDGSAGGNWLDLDSLPLAVTQVGYIRFNGTSELEIDAVAINTAQQGAPVPEPASALLAGIAFALCATRRYRRA
jgi:hypothetical protein